MYIIVQVTKLDTDPASAAAKPGSAAPAKVAAPPPSTHDPKTGPWVRFWQDKPQHWGAPPAVKSTADLAAANIQRNSALPPFKPPTEPATAHHAAASRSPTDDIFLAGACDMQATGQAAGTAARVGGIGSVAESSAAAVSLVQASSRSSSDDQASAGVVTAKQIIEPVAAAPESTLAGNNCHLSFKAAASTNTAVSGAPKPASVPVSAADDADVSAASAKPAGKQAAYNMYSPSKATLQVLRKPPSKEPSPRKQVPLHQLLARQAAQGQPQGHVTSSENLQQQQQQQQQQQSQHPQQSSAAADSTTSSAAAEQPVSRVVLPNAVQLPALSHQHAKLQGLALSQIDASVFAALPAEHQQELLHNLPKSTHRPLDAAPVESKQMGASDFAFITKLANLQKGDQSRSARSAAEGTQVPLDRSSGEAVNLDLKARCLSSAKPDGAKAAPSVAVVSASDVEACKAEEDAQISSPGDPAFISQLSADSGVGHAASHASPSVVDKGIITLDDQPFACHDHSDISKPAISAQQAQHAQQAQQPAPSIKSATDTAGNDKDTDVDQALDMDLMEEEWVALAAQGQHAEPNNRKHTLAEPPTADSAPHRRTDHSWDQRGNEAAHDCPSPKHLGQPSASSAPGPAQQQMQELRAAGTHKQPVSALPPASQIDSSVLDALPLQVRRELELAYGITTKSCSSALVGAQHERQLCAGLI